MIKTLKSILFPVALLLSFGFFLFLTNQIFTLYQITQAIHPVVGYLVLAASSGLTLGLLSYPLWVYFKLPKPLHPPTTEADLPVYRTRLALRLSTNPLLKAEAIQVSTTNLAVCVDRLNQEADLVIRDTSKMIFLTTAISQNGKLDAFTVLAAQLKMVWKITGIYYQRPTLREIGRIYAYVGASSLLATEIEDLDLTRQIEPVATSMLKNASGKSVPFIGSASTLIMDSLLEGSTNAFLSLRVGILTKNYCGALSVFDSKAAKRAAFKEAAKSLKSVTVKASSEVINSLIAATKNAGIDTLKSSWEGVKKTGRKVGQGISSSIPFQKKPKKLREP
ncbi:MAG: hypothetical protein ACI8QD_002358 [Cyclobacteriaceae bacterium]|jgi:hypothetical protein